MQIEKGKLERNLFRVFYQESGDVRRGEPHFIVGLKRVSPGH